MVLLNSLKEKRSDSSLNQEPGPSSVEELSKKMDQILERLSLLENMVAGSPEGGAIAATLRLMRAGVGAYGEPLKIAARLKSAEGVLKDAAVSKDDISRCIVQSLALRESLNISALTREVEAMRGKASRRIIRDRLKQLEEKGLIEKIDGKVPKYKLRNT